MKIKELLNPEKGNEYFMLGNEAAVRGVLECGLSLAATYPGTPSSEIGDILYKVAKNAKAKVKELYNWNKIAQDTHFTYQKAICQTMAEKQANQIMQENAEKAKKAKNTDNEITNLLAFKKKHAYA